MRLFPNVRCGEFRVLFPGGGRVSPDFAVHQPIYLVVEVDGAFEASVRTAGIVAVQLFHGHTAFLDGEFFLNTSAEYVRLEEFHQFFGFVLVEVVDDDGVFVHFLHHARVVLELKNRSLQEL